MRKPSRLFCVFVVLILTACGAAPAATSSTTGTTESAPTAVTTAPVTTTEAAMTAAPAMTTAGAMTSEPAMITATMMTTATGVATTAAMTATSAMTTAAMTATSAMTTTTSSGAIKIAVMGPFTGGAASIGQEQLNFAKLAVDDFNKANNMQVQIVEGDTELDPAKATDVVQRLVADSSVYAIVGPAGSQEVLAIGPIAEPASLAMVSPSATRPDLTEKNFKTLFRVVPRDDVQGPTDANFMIDQLKVKKVYIIDDQTAYSTGLRDEVAKVLKAKGITVTEDSVSQKDTDFSGLVTKLKGATPDAIFIPWQLAPKAALLAKQMVEQGVKATLFGGDGLFAAKDFIDGAAGATDGAYVSFFAPDVSSIASSKSIVDAYKAKYGDVGPFGAPAYAAATVALEAIQRAQKAGPVSRASVLAELPKTNESTSILGIPVKFDSKGDIQNAAFYLFQVKDGKFQLVTQSK